jgi:Chaperone of endosialidase
VLGIDAGFNLTTGSNNIDIGNAGVAGESGKIRIGAQGTQTAAFMAGISGVGVTGGAAVEVTSAGQLGIVMSSSRYKHDIRDLGAASGRLLQLRPVSFRYNNDPTNTLQYGLVAEEVAQVYPELVSYGPDGKPLTVRYSMLSAMLLNELQKRTLDNRRLAAQLTRQAHQLASVEQRLTALEHREAR